MRAAEATVGVPIMAGDGTSGTATENQRSIFRFDLYAFLKYRLMRGELGTVSARGALFRTEGSKYLGDIPCVEGDLTLPEK